MSSNTFPQRLWRPLAEVKNFIEKMPNGATMTTLSQKVKTFGSLSKKDKEIFISCMDGRDGAHVFKARPNGSKALTTFFLHKKYDIPNAIPGYSEIITGTIGKRLAELKASSAVVASSPMKEKAKPTPKAPESAPISLPSITAKVVPQPAKADDETETEVEEVQKDKSQPNKPSQSAEAIRKRALEMLLEADAQDKKQATDLITNNVKPRIAELIERMNKANDNVQNTLDLLYDQMAEVDKVALAFKQFAESI